jgi:signal transduction histidine kinase
VRLTTVERWISKVRVLALPLAVAAVALADQPGNYKTWGWITTACFAIGTAVFFVLARSDLGNRNPLAQSIAAQVFDTVIVTAFVLAFGYERGLPVQQLLYLDLAAACVRFGIVGGITIALISAPILILFERLRSNHLDLPFSWALVGIQTGIEIVMALIVGWLVERLARESRTTQERAEEAEALRDELGRRADLIDVANRCARALSSSLDAREAFAAFIRELRLLISFDRVAIILAEDGLAFVVATAGAGSETVFPSGSHEQLEGTLLEDALRSAQPIYRRELDGGRYPEEQAFIELGLGSRLVAPLLTGARSIGMLALLRCDEDAFTPAEIELAGLLGRLVATAAQNLRSYEVERRTVDELRRLSGLRADFVSLVSHELRSPMAAVIGAARTLQGRWRDLTTEQREAFLTLIADETERLAALVADVLDTSRIESGSFSYTFGPVDLAGIVEEATATASLAQQDVGVVAHVPTPLPRIEGDAARLRQVLTNLIDNAIKYSPAGEDVVVRATPLSDAIVLDVTDRGPGIAESDQQLIFEKFGRVHGTATKPGSGLGLFIARSIVEAHGGSLEVASSPGLGATFTVTLPVAASIAA